MRKESHIALLFMERQTVKVDKAGEVTKDQSNDKRKKRVPRSTKSAK